MAKYRNYVMAKSLDEAYELNQKKSSVIVAGNMWLRMCGLNKQTAIDLSLLGLDQIEETEEYITIGAMTTLRALETSAALDRSFGGVFARALAPIVGTQFRATATVGGSVYSRFGFSDRDVITHVRIRKGQRAAVESVRVSGTDIPVLVCAAARSEAGTRIVLGARPARAVIAAEGVADAQKEMFDQIAERTAFGDNLRASAAYRRRIAPVLMERAYVACREE